MSKNTEKKGFWGSLTSFFKKAVEFVGKVVEGVKTVLGVAKKAAKVINDVVEVGTEVVNQVSDFIDGVSPKKEQEVELAQIAEVSDEDFADKMTNVLANVETQGSPKEALLFSKISQQIEKEEKENAPVVANKNKMRIV